MNRPVAIMKLLLPVGSTMAKRKPCPARAARPRDRRSNRDLLTAASTRAAVLARTLSR